MCRIRPSSGPTSIPDAPLRTCVRLRSVESTSRGSVVAMIPAGTRRGRVEKFRTGTRTPVAVWWCRGAEVTAGEDEVVGQVELVVGQVGDQLPLLEQPHLADGQPVRVLVQ